MGCVGVAARAALPIAFALMLGAAPEEARAGACNDAGLSSGCVKKGDIAEDSLSHKDIKNESRGYGALGNDAFKIPARFKPYAQVTLTPPTDGWLVITASANIGTGISTNNNEAESQIVCRFRIGRRFSTSKSIFGSRFLGSVSRKSQPFVSIAWSAVSRKVTGGKKRTVFLACKLFLGTRDLSISGTAMTVVFHPVEY